MNFEWKIQKGQELSFEDKVHNLACFEIVLNILRMKSIAGDNDTQDEIQALCGFALNCMFGDADIDDDLFSSIMQLKDKKVHQVRSSIIKQMGIPEEMVDAREIGEA